MTTFIDVMPHHFGGKLDFSASYGARSNLRIVFTSDAPGDCAPVRTQISAEGLTSNTADLLARIGAMTDDERGDVLRMLDTKKEEE